MGRKRIELPSDIASKIREYSSRGLTKQNIADLLEISLSTLERRMEGEKDLEIAFRAGRAKSVNAVAEAAYHMAISGRYPNMTLYWLKAHGGWGDDKNEEELEFTFKLAYSDQLPPP